MKVKNGKICWTCTFLPPILCKHVYPHSGGIFTMCMACVHICAATTILKSVIFDSFQHFIVHVNTLNNSTEICNDNRRGPWKVNLKCWSARVFNRLPTKLFSTGYKWFWRWACKNRPESCVTTSCCRCVIERKHGREEATGVWGRNRFHNVKLPSCFI